jgi:hypothetical protein
MRSHHTATASQIPMILAFLRCTILIASSLFAYVPLITLIGSAHAETTTHLDAIVGAGALRVGLTEDYRPLSVAEASGNIEASTWTRR